MLGLPLDLLVSFTLFATFLFYQQKHASTFRGANQLFGEILTIWAGLGFVVEIGFLLYVAYQMSVWGAVKLFGISLLLWIPLMIVEVGLSAKIPLLPILLSLAGFLAVPVFGYLMIIAVP